MALQSIGLGTTEGDGTGDSIRAGGDKINDNFSELYTLLGTGTTLSSGISASATVVTLAAPSITGVASFADGSASAPAITNTGDANTGIFFSAADTVAVTTGGTLRTSVDSNGLSVTGSGTFSGAVQPNASDSAALGSASLEWSDLFLADSAVINFGDDQDTKLTHTDGAGLTLNSTNKIMFNDASQFIQGSSATVLSIAATDEIDLTATAVDLNGTLNVSGTLTQGGVATFVGRPVMSSGVTIADGSTIGSASTAAAMTIASTGIVTFVDDILIKNNGTIGSAGAATAMTISSAGIVTFVDDILIKDGGTIGSASDVDSIAIASNGVVTFSQAPVFPDGSIPLADLDIDGATDIGAAIVDADLFIIDDGAGGANRKVAASRIATYIGLPRGYLSGMGLANATDTAHDITVGIGEVRDNANAADIILASAFTKRIDATWASGSGNGGLASGVSIATNTWYHVHAIIVSGSTDIGFDTSITAANLVANNSASAFRRIGAVLTDGSSNILNFIQDGDEFIFKAQIVNINASAIGTSRVTQAVSAPLGVQTRAILGLVGQVANSNNSVRFTLTHPDVTDATPTSQNANNSGENSSDNNGTFASGTHIVLTNTSSQIAIRQDFNSTTSMNTNGYYDRRGQG